MKKDLEKYIIFETISGSRAYGYANELTSDTDLRGLTFSPGKEYYLGFLNKFESKTFKSEDRVLFELRNFLKLACDNNPNILELLFIDEKFWIKSSPEWELILKNREYFLSRNAKHRFLGYAFAQKKRLISHKKWRDLYLQGKRPSIPKKEDYIHYRHGENVPDFDKPQFKNAQRNYREFDTWIKRDNKRKHDELKYGYDVKFGVNIVRLLLAGQELLDNKKMTIPYLFADEMKNMLNGGWEYDKLIEFIELKEKEFEVLYETTKLPNKPNRNKIDKLCVYLIEKFLEKNI